MDRAPPHGAVDRPIYRASNENFHRSSAISEMESRLQRLERELAKERKKNTFLQGLHTAWEKDIEIIKDDFDRNERIHEEKINELKLKIKEDESTKSKLNEDIQKIGAMLENQRRDFESRLADKDSALANVDKTKTMWETETVELKAQLKEKRARESESRGMIEQLQRVNHNLELERNDLQNRLNGSEEAIGKMEKSEKLLKSKMDSKEIHLNELKALIEKLQTEITKKDNRGVERSKEIQDMQKSNRDMQVAQKELNDRLKASEGSNAIYKLNTERTTKELQSKIDRGEQRVKKCEASMKQLRQRNNELEIERNGLRDRLLVSEKAAGKMKSIENKLQSKIHSEELLQQNMKELETYTEKLQSEIERKNVREAELNKVIQDLQKSNRDNEVARNQMRNMLKSSEGLNATYMSDMEKMKEEMQSRIDAKEQKVKECEASMEKLFAKLEEKRTAELALKDAIKDLKQSNSDIELERMNLKATLQRFKTDYEAKLSITKEKLQSAIDSKEQMRGKVEELEAAAKGLQAKLEEKHAEVDELSLQINLQKQIDHDLAIERDRLLNTNKSLEDSFVNSQRERETIEQKLQSKSDEHEANVTVLRTQIEAMKTERNNLNKKIIQLETEVSLLKNLSEREQLGRKLASTEKLKADSKVLSARKDDRSSVASDVCISGDTASLIDRSSSQASDANESEHHITQNNSGYKQDQRTEDSTSLSGSFRKIGYKFWKKFGNEWFEGEVKFIYPVIHSYYEDGDDDIVKEEEFKKLYEQGEISNVDPKSRAQCSQSTKSRGNGKRRRQKRQRMK